MDREIYFCINRRDKKAEILPFKWWEECQMAFAWGILMSHGQLADGIGRCRDLAEFNAKAEHSKIEIL